MARADSRKVGLALIGTTAEWAAVSGRHDAAVLLEAHCEKQYERTGLAYRSEPYEVERMEHSRLAVNSGTREKLERKGRALTYEQALQALTTILAGGP